MRCPICGNEAAPRPANTAAPFCSARCKQIDLAKWLNEDYRVPTDEPDDESPSPGAPPASEER